MEPNSALAQLFLAKWAPNGPWAVVAIPPDRKDIVVQTFYPAQKKELFTWLEVHNGKDNIYFHVNPVLKAVRKKANRTDIKSMDWLHVDIDPRAGENVPEEQKRILGVLTKKLPEGIPPPTVVIFSGGGYQGFWKLKESIPINGDEAIYEDIKRYNQQLELLFGGDNCHNIDRIMRVPGTINLPDTGKRKKGRTEALAELVHFEDDLVYELGQFNKAPEVQTGNSTLSGVEVKVSGNVQRVQSSDELDEWKVPDELKIIMAQGRHPDKPLKGSDTSRSAWLFYFCCELVRHKVPDDTIFAIITDSQWGISESVLEMKSSASKYALRQLQRARENAVDPWLTYFNDRYAVIKKYGGKCLIITEVEDHALKRTRLMKMTMNEFSNGYENKNVKIGEDSHGNPKYKPAGTWWRTNAQRRQFDTIAFAPEHETKEDCYNMWKGFAVESIPGECGLFLQHVQENVCGGNKEHYDYLIGWLARMMQSPGQPGEVAVVLRGKRGVGKSFFTKVVGRLLGRHYMPISNSGHLVGHFNSHLRDLILLFADEAFYAGDKRHESVLKMIITEDTIPIEAKGVDVESAPNYIHLIIASNEIHVIPAGADERRFFVLDVGTAHQKDSPYFAAIAKQMDSGGYEALLYYLRTHDISEYEVRDVPTTEALREQKLLSLDPDSEWWYQKLLQGQLLYDGGEWPETVMNRDLIDDYVDHVRRHNVLRGRSSETRLGRFIKQVLPRLRTYRRRVTVETPTNDGYMIKKNIQALFYRMPTLEECRKRWETLHGATYWPPEETEQVSFETPEF